MGTPSAWAALMWSSSAFQSPRWGSDRVVIDSGRPLTSAIDRMSANSAVEVDQVGDQLQHAGTGRADAPGDAEQLVGRGGQARRRPPVRGAVVDRPRRREAEGPGPDRPRPPGVPWSRSPPAVGTSVVVGTPVAHHVAPQRPVRDLGGDVHGVGQALDHVEVLREALPPPADPLGQRRAGDVLHALHQGDEPVVAVGLHRGEADAAVAHDHRGDALPRGRGQQRVPGDLAVVVGVDVDPARRDQQTVGVQLLAPGAGDLAHEADPTVVHGHVGNSSVSTGPVDDRATPDHEVMLSHGMRVRPGHR